MKTLEENFQEFMTKAYHAEKLDPDQYKQLKIAFYLGCVVHISNIANNSGEISDEDMSKHISSLLRDGHNFLVAQAVQRTVEKVLEKAFEGLGDPPNQRGITPAKPDEDESQSFSA